MFVKLAKKIFGNKSEKDVKALNPLVLKINELDTDLKNLSDEALKNKTIEFKDRLSKGETLDDILVEAFAVVREAARRRMLIDPEWKMVHFDVQLVGGMVLHQGKIAEMKTGEGKTLVATLPAYLNALTGNGVHIVTVNDYLAKRDRNWMGPLYEFLGLKVGVIQNGMSFKDKREAYAADITYGTNNEFGFDYLRDNMATHPEERVQRGHTYAIVDEVDSILIDEARTPLIISGPSEESTDKYYEVDQVVPKLKEGEDYQVEEKDRRVTLTEAGVAHTEKILRVDNLYDHKHIDLVHHMHQALKAHKLFKLDVDYVNRDGQIMIVDEFTGRILEGRRYSDGLHQAIEAKEKVKIESENQTLATITLQNYFRLYKKLAGMTGTAETEAKEFFEIYKLDVVVIPPNRIMIRDDQADVIYKTRREKFNAVINEILEWYKIERPVLVGTISIENSELLSEMLKKKGVKHSVLNAKFHAKEAEIVASAGQKGTITIATNMAGRGTDIVLGEGVVALGGLHIIGTERHESRRIDNQLRGRAGRQGDPGSTRFYLSLEDDLMRLFGSDRLIGIMDKLGMEEGQDIQHPMVTKAIENAQKRVEGHNFEIRKHVLEYDDVMNKQREVIYEYRNHILQDEDITSYIQEILSEVLDIKMDNYANPNLNISEWNLKGLKEWAASLCQDMDLSFIEDSKNNREFIREKTYEEMVRFYKNKNQELEPHIRKQIERNVLLSIIDTRWREHLCAMDFLRDGINLRAYAQKNPLIEYKHEGYEVFMSMIETIKEEIINYIFRLQIVSPEREVQEQQRRRTPMFLNVDTSESKTPAKKDEASRVGRNDPCPCGSGKKYKKCCIGKDEG
ncbi:preprotein translocase subunit SecA [Candidatus Poribacteria bacterium]|nr:preprotein translocase subunit SecA [Candidatus Poribacteria bacterium]